MTTEVAIATVIIAVEAGADSILVAASAVEVAINCCFLKQKTTRVTTTQRPAA
jgi:hypothetical protein